jgi:hypothetical protein
VTIINLTDFIQQYGINWNIYKKKETVTYKCETAGRRHLGRSLKGWKDCFVTDIPYQLGLIL